MKVACRYFACISFSILLYSPSFSNGDHEFNQCELYKSINESIYEFERVINENRNPSCDDLNYLFGVQKELYQEIKYRKNICEKQKSCDDKISYFLLYLKSKNGPLFAGNKQTKIKIYVYPKLKVDRNQQVVEVMTIIDFNGREFKKGVFEVVLIEEGYGDFGRITSIKIDDKEILL